MRRVVIPAALATVLLSGCAGMVRTVTSEYPQTAAVARENLQDAAAAGPVLLEVRDNPFPDDAARSLARAASATSVGFDVRFTTDRAQAGRSDFRLVVQFSPAPGISAAEVCDSSRPVAKAATDGLTAVVAFCKQAQPILSLTAVGPRADGPDSSVIRQIAEQAMMRMFIPSGSSYDNPGDYWPDI